MFETRPRSGSGSVVRLRGVGLPVQVPTATTREARPLVSGWASAQRVMIGQSMNPKQGNLNINLCVSFISARHERVV